MAATVFVLQSNFPAPGEPQRARIVTEPVYPNAAVALATWEALRASVPAHVTVLRMIAAPVLDRASGYHSGLRGFRLLSDGQAPVELVAAQVEAMNAVTTAGAAIGAPAA